MIQKSGMLKGGLWKAFSLCLIVVMVVSLAFSGCAAAPASGPVKIKFSTPYMEMEPPAMYGLHVMDLVEKKMGDRVKIERFTAGTMGNVLEHLGLVKSGAVDVITLHVDQYPQELPLHRILNMEQQVDRVTCYNNIVKITQEISQTKSILDAEAKKNGIVMLEWVQMGPTGIMTKEKASSLNWLKGKKINVIAGWQRNVFEELGFIPANVAIPELYEGMLRGVIDAIWMATAAAIPLKWFEVAKSNLVIGEMTVCSQPLAFNQKSWDKLPKDVQQAFKDASKETALWSNENDKAMIDGTYGLFKEKGVDIVNLPQSEVDLFYGTLAKHSIAESLKGAEAAGVKDKAETILKYWEPLIGLK
ncbi:MAG TPA: TRAP transporter substrate-binding protein DctP [Dehalococcoidia bacterium]|nr:TRAP transporter substrate-binding protein DctP [Dehalococcoidia bacterium]